MSYVDRLEAVAQYGDGDPAVDETHIFQGDIFHSVEFRAPHLDEPVQMYGVVLSHDCEYTKTKNRPDRFPLTLAPARLLAAADKDQQQQIRDNKFRNAMYLPAAEKVEDEYFIDFRLAQPFITPQLFDWMYIASMGAELRDVLQLKLIEHFTRRILG